MSKYRQPPFDLDVCFRVDDTAIGKIGKLLDDQMDWSGRGVCSPASREIVTIILGIIEAKQAGEAKRAQKERQNEKS